MTAAELLVKTTLPPAKLFLTPLLQPPPPCLSSVRLSNCCARR